MIVENLTVKTLIVSLSFIKIKLVVKIVEVLNNILFKMYNYNYWYIYMIIKVVQYEFQMKGKKRLYLKIKRKKNIVKVTYFGFRKK